MGATPTEQAGRNMGDRSSNSSGLTMYRFLECTAAQYMTHPVMTVTRQVAMREMQALFDKYDFNSFPVMDDGKILGIITKFDFLKSFVFATGQMVPHYDELMQCTVAAMMTDTVVSVEAATPLTRVLQLMVSYRTRSFPVLGPERQLLGIISREDVMRALRETTGGDAH